MEGNGEFHRELPLACVWSGSKRNSGSVRPVSGVILNGALKPNDRGAARREQGQATRIECAGRACSH